MTDGHRATASTGEELFHVKQAPDIRIMQRLLHPLHGVARPFRTRWM
jgi:hypothetical protein